MATGKSGFSLVGLVARRAGLHKLSPTSLALLLVVLTALAGLPSSLWTVALGFALALVCGLPSFLRVRRQARRLQIRCRRLTADYNQLKHSNRRAADGSRLKSEFLANVSHDLRTPMNGIIGFTALALETRLSEDQRQYLESVRSCSESLLGLLNEILDFSKLEADKLVLEKTEFDLRELVESVADVIAPAAGRKGLEVVPVVSPEAPSRVCGDPNRLRQVITNLAGNAVKFTERGEVVIRAGIAEAGEGDALIRFEISDTGVGIPKAEQEKIFERFAQTSEGSAVKHGGTGLGLAISKRLATLMGGEIGVDSEPGAGSTFWFTARLAPAASDNTTRRSYQELKGLKVLVVDDSEAVCAALAQSLESFGCLPFTAGSTNPPLALLEEAALAGSPYAVAMFDMGMPGLGHEDIARLVKKEAPFDKTALVVLSPVGSSAEIQLLNSGIASKLSKPVKHTQLLEALLRVVRGNQQVSDPDLGDCRQGPAEPLSHSSKGKVLLAEDNVINQRLACRILEKAGYHVDAVETGSEVIKALARESYEVVLMDVHMPDMDGLTATSAIRELEGSARHTPVIAMTADAREEDRARCLGAGMDDYLSKPIRCDQLISTVSRWAVGTARQSQQASRLPAPPDAYAAKIPG